MLEHWGTPKGKRVIGRGIEAKEEDLTDADYG